MKHIKEFYEFINEKWSDHRDEWDADSRTLVDKAAEKFVRRAMAMKIDGTNVTDKSKLDTLKKAANSGVIGSNKQLRSKFIKDFKLSESQVNEASLVDYSKSKNKILVGLKTDLLRNMKDRYKSNEDGDNIHFFDKGKHIGTLFDLGSRYQELRHDGTIDDKGYRINEDLDSTVSDPEIEEAWEKIYGHPLKHDHPSIFKILKQRPPIDSRELDRLWSECFDKTFKDQHPRVWDILFSETKE